jgi:hypothetical protein
LADLSEIDPLYPSPADKRDGERLIIRASEDNMTPTLAIKPPAKVLQQSDHVVGICLGWLRADPLDELLTLAHLDS